MINERAARRYCKDDISKIENYEKAVNDITQKWEIHHRTEIWWNCTRKELIDNECYYNRSAKELIFLTKAEHNSVHHKGSVLSTEHRQKIAEAHKGMIQSEDTRKKLSAANSGENNPMYGKTHSAECRQTMSAINKGENNPMYGKTHSAESRKKMSEARKAYLARRRLEE